MNCLIVIPSLRRAGAEAQAVDLANGLVNCGHVVHIFTFAGEDDQKDRLLPFIKLHHYPRHRKLSVSYIVALRRLLDDERIDVIYGVMQFATLIGWIASMGSTRKVPIVASIHTTTNYDSVSELADRLIYRTILRRVAAVIFVCKFQRDYWIKKYPALRDRSVVVYNGIDTRQFNDEEFLSAGQALKDELAIDNGMFVFSCIAGFRPEKGHELLIEAFSKLSEKAVLLLAGDGSTKPSIEILVDEMGLAGRVKFLGNIADVRPLIAASDATILASTAVETFSIAMLESLAMATPMIVPRIGGLAEAIIDGKTGMLFPVGDYQAMSQCMQSFMLDLDRTTTIGIQGQEKIHQEFTLEEMIRASESVLKSVVDPSSAKSK